ncbi:MAG: hypothetical protein JXN61_16860 [Sedimentisphaerales bacterium]|nr:hypothetical protein [Sedimentisphaerales bacterium]
MDTVLYIVGSVLFLTCITGYIIVQIKLRPRDDSDLDDYYHEFEEQHPGYARYLRWSRITFTAAIIAALILFLTRVL